MNIRLLIFCLLILTGTHLVNAQDFFRIKADISVKSKKADGSEQLTMGTVYYDKNYKKVVYDLVFPGHEVIVIRDTMLFQIKEGKVVDTMTTMIMPEFTIFHLALNNKMKDYGLDGSFFTLDNVEKDGELVISTWIPPKEGMGVFGNVMIANKDRKLNGVVFFHADGRILGKQFYEEFTNVKGLDFPQRVVQFSYEEDEKKNTQLTTFKNIKVNDTQASHYYNYPLK